MTKDTEVKEEATENELEDAAKETQVSALGLLTMGEEDFEKLSSNEIETTPVEEKQEDAEEKEEEVSKEKKEAGNKEFVFNREDHDEKTHDELVDELFKAQKENFHKDKMSGKQKQELGEQRSLNKDLVSQISEQNATIARLKNSKHSEEDIDEALRIDPNKGLDMRDSNKKIDVEIQNAEVRKNYTERQSIIESVMPDYEENVDEISKLMINDMDTPENRAAVERYKNYPYSLEPSLAFSLYKRVQENKATIQIISQKDKKIAELEKSIKSLNDNAAAINNGFKTGGNKTRIENSDSSASVKKNNIPSSLSELLSLSDENFDALEKALA